MNSEKLVIFGGAAVLVVVAYLGLSSVLQASALENERVDGINKARRIAALVSQDEVTFGTRFREAVMACAAPSTEAKLPQAVWQHYVKVMAAAAAKASDENYTPSANRRWFNEAFRAAATADPLPQQAYGAGTPDQAKVIEAAIAEINADMSKIGECLSQTAQK